AAARLVHEHADAGVLESERQTGPGVSGESLGDLGELVPVGRDVVVGQARLLPGVGVDHQAQGGEVLRGAIERAVVGEGVTQRLVVGVRVRQLLGVGLQVAVGGVGLELVPRHVEDVGGIAAREALAQLLGQVVGCDHLDRYPGLLAPRVDGRLDGVGLGVTRGADQHRHAPTFGGAGVAVFAFGGVGVPRVAGVGGGGGGLVTRGDRDGGVLRAVPAASGGDERYDREEE